MRDRQLGNLCPQVTSQSWNKPVHLTIELKAFGYIAAKRFERAAVVVQLHLGSEGNDTVGDLRRQATLEKGILPVDPPAVDQIVAFVEFRHEPGDISRIVLQITI